MKTLILLLLTTATLTFSQGELLNFIKNEEGLVLTAYKDGMRYSIGYGTVSKVGESISEVEAELRLQKAATKFQSKVKRALAKQPTKGELIALTSFAYNVGFTAFKHSTLLKHYNAGQKELAVAEFSKWIYSSGKVNPKLIRRRRREAEKFVQTN